MFENVLAEAMGAVIGVFVGTLLALAVDRRNQRLRRRERAKLVLRMISQELTENFNTLQQVRSAYFTTPFGKSFYVNTVAWETAIASGELSAIIGDDLTDSISDQYALLVRVRYYVDLLTRLWLTPPGIEGYEEIRRGFMQAIVETMNRAINKHDPLLALIAKGSR